MNPYIIIATIVGLLAAWAVASVGASLLIGAAIRLRDRRAARPRYRRSAR